MAGEIDFGDSECSAAVFASQLIPGVWVEGERFGHTDAVLVQQVIQGGALVKIIAAHTTSGMMHEVVLNSDRLLDVWGTL